MFVCHQRYETLIPFCNPKMAGPFPYTVVLHGPADVRKTTLAKKLMLDWTGTTLAEALLTPPSTSAARGSTTGGCAPLPELISANWPVCQDDMPAVWPGL